GGRFRRHRRWPRRRNRPPGTVERFNVRRKRIGTAWNAPFVTCCGDGALRRRRAAVDRWKKGSDNVEAYMRAWLEDDFGSVRQNAVAVANGRYMATLQALDE